MRLIDADEINYVGNHLGDEYEDRFHDAQWVYRDSIDRMPTIEAIPVEWLLNHILHDEVMHEYNRKLIEHLVIGWREETNEISLL